MSWYRNCSRMIETDDYEIARRWVIKGEDVVVIVNGFVRKFEF